MQPLRKVPFLVILAGIGALAMLIPAFHAAAMLDFRLARIFLMAGLLALIVSGLIAIATLNNRPMTSARDYLGMMAIGLVVLPVEFAFPLASALPDEPWLDLYFEMLSSFTTTGASVLDGSGALAETIHLWRALVAWMGGFLILVAGVAILAPLNLGGFEVLAGTDNRGDQTMASQLHRADVSGRLTSFAAKIGPIYVGATMVLALALTVSGDRALVATIHAMSTMSTSGITLSGSIRGDGATFWSEVLIFVFLMFAVTRLAFTRDPGIPLRHQILRDREVKMMAVLVISLPLLMFLRHWIAAFEFREQENLIAAFAAFWGSLFTVLSFLTTTGFESANWASARHWSGLETPGLILFGLVVVGGGVATTAGGIKLLRVYALSKHGTRELQKLAYPSSVGGAGGAARRIRREGAYVAWMFFMLFAMATAATMLALSLTGLDFEQSLAFSVAGLSTTGPLAPAVLGEAGAYDTLGDVAKLILMAAMLIGRLETLALIALLNPEFWWR
jgi:trk system potassium uptake protein TrkH